MKKYLIMTGILISVIFHSCGRSGDNSYAPDPEAERLEKIGRLDTVSIQEKIYPDTISGFDDLAKFSAEAWILVDDATGCVISEKNAEKQMYMASLTKMMTCLIALESGHGGDSILLTDSNLVAEKTRVRVGESYLKEDLIREMMLVSDNGAAYALANHIAGDTLRFYDAMNEKARYLGMFNTHFASPNGLPNNNNYSTARDMLALARYCMADSLFAAIVGTAEQDIPLLDGRYLTCYNTNNMLRTYDGCIGIKTGFTYQAGACLAAAATRDGITLYSILLKSRNKALRFRESAALMDYGFNVMKAYHEACSQPLK